MPESWNEIEEDDILNSTDTATGLIAKYDRIMSRKLRDAIINLTDSFNTQTSELINSIDKFNDTNTKLSARIYWLNIVLVFLTLILVVFGAVQIYPLIVK
jgi:beta-mannanase